MTLLSIVLGLAAVLAAIPALVFAFEIASARRAGPAPSAAATPRPRVAVLVPAHNEAAGIAATLASIAPQLRPGDRLLVVADNCSDATAQVARSAQAEVVERQDSDKRGKGHALDFGIRHLHAAPPEVLIVVDADCTLHPGSVDVLAAQCAATDRPAQALDLMRAAGTSLAERWAEFTWRVKNQARPLGLARWGGPCPLMGTGMAFPWPLVSRPALLASGHLVEDMMLGVELAMSGRAARFAPHALVTSAFPPPGAAANSQRTRWEHGHLATLLSHGPALLWAGMRRGSSDAIVLALDLMVPPLSLLVMLLAALLALHLALGLSGVNNWSGAWISAAALALVVSAVLSAWRRFGRDLVAAHELLAAPLQALRKLPLYARYLWRRQTEWVRARREGD
jgi:cellulose synthase/poly-beta-1,6-N-acetylglucosamine synthase-like glycosyltransferase